MPQLIGFLRGNRISHWAVMVQNFFGFAHDAMVMGILGKMPEGNYRGDQDQNPGIKNCRANTSSFLFVFYSSLMTPLYCSSIFIYCHILSSPNIGT
jgi:hypothetical protein